MSAAACILAVLLNLRSAQSVKTCKAINCREIRLTSRQTLVGFQHHVVAAVLTAWMAIIVALFLADMVTRKDESRDYSKLVDVTVGCVWFAIVGFLVMNSLRAGMW